MIEDESGQDNRRYHRVGDTNHDYLSGVTRASCQILRRNRNRSSECVVWRRGIDIRILCCRDVGESISGSRASFICEDDLHLFLSETIRDGHQFRIMAVNRRIYK